MLTEISSETVPENDSGAFPTGLPTALLMGVGGGGNAIAAAAKIGTFPLKRVFLDTYSSDLATIPEAAGQKILLGKKTLHGFGTGTEPERGAAAAKESEDRIRELFEKTDLLLLVAALGRGTGSGAAPVIAKIAREMGVIVICFATRPYSDEGSQFAAQANDAIENLRPHCNAFVLAENDAMEAPETGDVFSAHGPAAEWILRGLRIFAGTLFAEDANARLDFSAFRSVFPVPGARTLFAIGTGTGAETAVENALSELSSCPFFKTTVSAARSETLLLRIETGTPPQSSIVDAIADRVQGRFGGSGRMLTKIAVVPERGDTIEISVLGASEIRTAKRKNANRAAAPKKAKPSTAEAVSEPEEEDLLFDPDRGAFWETRKNLYEGIDLDAPTFRRKKINLQRELETRKNGATGKPDAGTRQRRKS